MAAQKSLHEIEEAKRERASDPVKRWRQIQEAITWAEANMKPEFRRNRPRMRPLPGSPKTA
jgi:hypothetical protein